MRVKPTFLVKKVKNFTAAYAIPSGTCLYIKLVSGAELFNSTAYSCMQIANAQSQCAEYFGISSLGTIFVDYVPAKIDARGLALLGFTQQLLGVLNVNKTVVDGGTLEVVQA